MLAKTRLLLVVNNHNTGTPSTLESVLPFCECQIRPSTRKTSLINWADNIFPIPWINTAHFTPHIIIAYTSSASLASSIEKIDFHSPETHAGIALIERHSILLFSHTGADGIAWMRPRMLFAGALPIVRRVNPHGSRPLKRLCHARRGRRLGKKPVSRPQ